MVHAVAEVKRTALALLCCSSILVVGRSQAPPQDGGAPGAWQKMLKLRTIASLMHTTAHPDDEHGGMLAKISRGEGARVSLLTLTRGESGDNAIGSELFDSLGLIRTEELLVSGRYYGIGRQYFTTAVDFGFSKRLDETLDKWGREHVLREVVRVIRTDRPLVLVSRFQGNARDGHGNHQAAGLITQEAWKAAGDPAVFPEQIREGLRPWQPWKLYMGGVRENEDWTLRLETGEYSPALGESYDTFARLGLSFQRSQNSGRFNPQAGPSVVYYKRLETQVPQSAGATASAGGKETSFFDGIEMRIEGLSRLVRGPVPQNVTALLRDVDRHVEAAFTAFTMYDPAAAVPSLARGLGRVREALALLKDEPEAVFRLQVKEDQFMDAINAALGLDLSAVAQPASDDAAASASPFAPAPTLGAVVPGQTFDVRLVLTNRSPVPVVVSDLDIRTRIRADLRADTIQPATLTYNASVLKRIRFTLPDDAPLSRPYFRREGIQQARYDVLDPADLYSPTGTPVFAARASYTVDGVPVRLDRVVRSREPQLPYGYAMREVKVVPALAVNVLARQAVVPLAAAAGPVPVDVELVNNRDGGMEGTLTLRVPDGWRADPAAATFAFARAAEKRRFRFTVSAPGLGPRDYRIEAVATSKGRDYREGYSVIDKRDLESRFIFRPADVGVRGVDVKVAPGLTVGYVMGVGDEVPSGIAQLGATVQLLGERDLASADLRKFDAIVTGTRAYAVREDLRTYNQRLLDYVKAGGNLIVLYNTAELDPKAFAPFPGELTLRAEEVSEEDSPVEFLAPTHPVFHHPNVITKADFDGWVEQRGTKFWSSWDPAYTALIATWDKGQPPQAGGWLHAKYGSGHYTYFAYAFHRQLPYAVPGAYRLLANLLSLGKPYGRAETREKF
jgi:LmbE family N-acetylglucosaminyl deacetylase